MSLASGEVVKRTLPEARFVYGLSWNRRGDRLAVVGETENGAHAVWIATPTDEGTRRLQQPAEVIVTGACWSPVADALYLERQRRGTTEVVRVGFREQDPVDEENLLTGLPSVSADSPCRVSADGQRLLQVRAFESASALEPIAWAADGSSVYAYRPETPEVLRVSVATGVVQTIGRFPVGLLRGWDMCSMTPDRRAIICSLTDVKTDAWVVDYFDPHVPPPKPKTP